MSKFTITIETNNAAFQPEPCYEVARILRDLADKLAEGGEPETVRDYNGGTVGRIEYDAE